MHIIVILVLVPFTLSLNPVPTSGVVGPVPGPLGHTSSSSSSSRCQEISIPMCKTIRYNYTEMPNSFNHETQVRV